MEGNVMEWVRSNDTDGLSDNKLYVTYDSRGHYHLNFLDPAGKWASGKKVVAYLEIPKLQKID